MPPELADPLEYQSANLEKDLFDHVGILRLNPTRFDAVVHGDSANAKDLERRFPVWLAQVWAQLNPGRKWDSAVGEGQARHGIKVPWLRWRKQDGHQQKRMPFYWDYTNIQGCFWTETSDGLPDAFVYRYAIPVVESDIRKDGKKVTLDSVGKLGWIGLAEPYDMTYVQDKKVDVIITDERDPDGRECEEEWCKFAPHPKRRITVYVCPAGKSKEAEYIEEYDSPFPVCSFFLVGGNVSEHETDPHLKYRPLMLGAYNEQFWQNTLKSLLATQAREAHGDKDIYAAIGSIPPEMAGMFQESGEARKIILPDATEIPILPELSRWPRNIDPSLLALLTKSEEAMISYRPNRFLTGFAHQEASNATGTAYLAGLQQAGMPYNMLLANSDAQIKLALESIIHALCYWSMGDPEEAPSRYHVPVAGETYTMRNSNAYRPGQSVYIEPKELMKYDWDIVLKTESKTKAEQQSAALFAYEAADRGYYTDDDVMKALDIYDIESQHEALFIQGIHEDLQPFERAIALAYLKHKASAQTGVSFDAIMQGLNAGSPSGPQYGGQGPRPALTPNNLTTPPNNVQGRGTFRQAPDAQMARSESQLQLAANGAQPELQGGAGGY